MQIKRVFLIFAFVEGAPRAGDQPCCGHRAGKLWR